MISSHLVISALLFVVAPPPSLASSYDCAKAESKVEKLICDTPAISQKDNEMKATYATLLRKMPEEIKGALTDAQNDWINQRSRECETDQDMESCLLRSIQNRQQELERLNNAKTGKWLKITIQLPVDGMAYSTAVRHLIEEGKPLVVDQKFRPIRSVARGTDPIWESASAVARYILRNSQDPEAHLSYVRVQNGVAHTKLDIDGWAGVGYTIGEVTPIVEKTLLQFPEIKRVTWDPRH